MDAAEQVHLQFLAALDRGTLRRRSNLGLAEAGLAPDRAAALVHSQMLSRQLDRLSRKLQARGEGFYTIGSSGHEGNAALAEALRTDDIAFLHYRDAAFQIHRAGRVPGETPAWDMLLSFTASADDPISGGRHKVLGSKRLMIPPQTSTIASHLPKAVGAAFSIGIARRMGWTDTVLAQDGVVLCSFGDASANHSTAVGALNTAAWAAYQNTPMPIVFLCEDNGIGISTRTPPGWIEANWQNRAGLRYIACDGSDLIDSWRAAKEAVDFARRQRKPVFLHMKTVRLYGHAGNDVQGTYLSKEHIRRDEARDPLLASAALLIEGGVMTAAELRARYDAIEATLARQVELAIKRPKLPDAAAVMASIVPPKREGVARPLAPAEARAALFADDAAAMEKPQHMAKLLSWGLADLLLQYPNAVVCGEDVGPKGGVYAVTQKLHQRFGSARVINTLLDEQAILGLAIGAAHNGLLPLPEVQFLAYVHNAEDQIRGEAATLSFFSDGQFTNPMVLRIAGLPYQKGFGGHFHNDNSLAVFRDIPGVVLAVPSCGRDAVAMLRECVRLAHEEQRVVVFVEPIALYMTRDLHAEGDGLWTSLYQPPGEPGSAIGFGEIGQWGQGTDLAIVTYGNGVYLSRQAEKLLAEQGVAARIIDLRWLGPVNDEAVLAACAPCRNVLVVDECRITGSHSEALLALFAERMNDRPVARLTATDSFIPLARAATHTLPSRDMIVTKGLAMVRGETVLG
ncbi:dehydrogenase E1 component subunit alpha/beta [Novosphingobium sp.]|uniref:dehydrogenase E1 component subunit alpha/beta n=1 Tax=Novosphingobium sp. TaxID=1874826 RepID=UPI0038BBA6B1